MIPSKGHDSHKVIHVCICPTLLSMRKSITHNSSNRQKAVVPYTFTSWPPLPCERLSRNESAGATYDDHNVSTASHRRQRRCRGGPATAVHTAQLICPTQPAQHGMEKKHLPILLQLPSAHTAVLGVRQIDSWYALSSPLHLDESC